MSRQRGLNKGRAPKAKRAELPRKSVDQIDAIWDDVQAKNRAAGRFGLTRMDREIERVAGYECREVS